MIALVALLVVVGWTVTVLAADSLPIRNKGWEVYEHLWLVLGLIAAVAHLILSPTSQGHLRHCCHRSEPGRFEKSGGDRSQEPGVPSRSSSEAA
jgi:hypothetical protein